MVGRPQVGAFSDLKRCLNDKLLKRQGQAKKQLTQAVRQCGHIRAVLVYEQHDFLSKTFDMVNNFTLLQNIERSLFSLTIQAF